jgi:hypothetical protein
MSEAKWIPNAAAGTATEYRHTCGAVLTRIEVPAKRRGARPKVRWELRTAAGAVYDLGPKATFTAAERLL